MFGDLSEMLAPMWVEIFFMLFFAIGFAFFPQRLAGRTGQKVKKKSDDKGYLLHKQIEADVEAGHSASALKAWQNARSSPRLPLRH